MRTRALAPLEYQVGDLAPAFRVRFEDSTIDPAAEDLTFRLATWFGNVIQCEGAATIEGDVAERTDATSGVTYYSFTLVYEWAVDDLDTAGTFFAQFFADVASLGGPASLPPDRSLMVRVNLAAVEATP